MESCTVIGWKPARTSSLRVVECDRVHLQGFEYFDFINTINTSPDYSKMQKLYQSVFLLLHTRNVDNICMIIFYIN